MVGFGEIEQSMGVGSPHRCHSGVCAHPSPLVHGVLLSAFVREMEHDVLEGK